MSRCRRVVISIVIWAVVAAQSVVLADGAIAKDCTGGFKRSSIEGEGRRVKLSLDGQSAACADPRIQQIDFEPQPYFTHEIACSADRQAAAQGFCSSTPCQDSGQFFAFRTLHRPDGSSTPAGFQCVSLTRAVATPGVTVAEVFAAVRTVKLPGGQIGVAPEVRGLANLESYFWLEGANQPPVELRVGGSRVQAEFRVVEYRWSFGGQEALVTTGPGTPGLESEVRTSFRRRGSIGWG
jgi:hypothetical protein